MTTDLNSTIISDANGHVTLATGAEPWPGTRKGTYAQMGAESSTYKADAANEPNFAGAGAAADTAFASSQIISPTAMPDKYMNRPEVQAVKSEMQKAQEKEQVQIARGELTDAQKQRLWQDKAAIESGNRSVSDPSGEVDNINAKLGLSPGHRGSMSNGKF